MLLNAPPLLGQLILGFLGLCAGGVIAAGVFAFLAMIGIFPRLIGRTQTKKRILLYETMIILGGTCGTIFSIYSPPLLFGGSLLLAIWGVSVGMFVGCLVMSLAETLKALPIIKRRIRLAVGFQYVVLAIGLGKCVGSLIYFFRGWGV